MGEWGRDIGRNKRTKRGGNHLCIGVCLFAWALLSAFCAAAPADRAPQADAPAAAPRPAIEFPPVKFVMALCRDLSGNIWIGTEDQGIWRFDPKTGKPTQYMPKDGLGDEHCYALACDTQGRIWAGHQSHGVSVFNGQKWQNYEVVAGLSRPDSLAGPLGERIFDIEVCPKDGDIWIATSLGLSRYSVSTGQWSYLTRMDGLPSDQIQCLAFEKDGTLWAGTQCDGLAVAKAPSYKSWKQITGPDKLPLVAASQGLPTNLINDLLVGRDGTIWVATTTGLAFSRDRGRSFRFVRGADWSDKVKGLYLGTPEQAKAKEPQIKEILDSGKNASTLLEDYTTCLAEDDAGRLWVGHRQQPYEVLDSRDGSRIHQGEQKFAVGKAVKEQDHYVARILPPASSNPGVTTIIGRYGFGLAATSLADEADVPQRRAADDSVVRATGRRGSGSVELPDGQLLPLPAQPLSGSETEDLLSRLRANDRKLARGDAISLGDDWSTKGDWVGRYGRQYSILCAADSPLNHYVAFGIGYKVEGMIGPHADNDDGLRHWVHWDKTDNPNTLWDPCVGHRRQAEWDDHGESYPMSREGPDLWAVVEVPAGVHQVALYFFNKDGHDGPNRWRDYTIEVKRWASDYEMVDRVPALARARVKDFWGGHYKVFAVNGPGKFLVKVGRNYSFNTIVSAVLVDRLTGKHEGLNQIIYFRPMPWMWDVRYDAPAAELGASYLWQTTESCGEYVHKFVAAHVLEVLAYRQIAPGSTAAQPLLARMRWKAHLWSAHERQEFRATMDRAWNAMKQNTPQLCGVGDAKE